MTRINIKVVVIALMAVVSIAGVGGVLYLLHVRGDAQRNINRAEQFLAEGDLAKAAEEYGKAVSKEVSNRDYLRAYIDTLLKLRPETQNRAIELYQDYVRALVHAATHYSQDPEAHLELLRELDRAGRLTGRDSDWEMLAQFSKDMLSGLPNSEPDRAWGHYYYGLAQLNRRGELSISDREEMLKDNLMVFVHDEMPKSDRGWATYLDALTLEAVDAHISGDRAKAAQLLDNLAAQRKTALENVPNGPWTALSSLRVLWQLSEINGNVSNDEFNAAIDHMVQAAYSADSLLVRLSIAQVLDLFGTLNELDNAINLLENALKVEQPESDYARLALVDFYRKRARFEDAERTARAIIDAERASVSLVGSMQTRLKVRAVAALGTVHFAQWQIAESDEARAAALADMRAARDEATPLTNPGERMPLLDVFDARIAFASGMNRQAATKIEPLLESASIANDVELLQLAGLIQDKLGNPGLAYKRMTEAAALRPRDARLLVYKAQLAIQLNKLSDAEEVLAQLETLVSGHEIIEQLRSSIDVARGDDRFADVRGMLQEGDFVAARTRLEEMHTREPEDLIVVGQLIGLEVSAGNMDAAQRWLAVGREVQADHPAWPRYDAALAHPDPINRVKAFAASTEGSPAEKAVSMAAHLNALVQSYGQRAVEMQIAGRTEEMREASALAERSAAELREAINQATPLAADDRRLFEIRFAQALRDQDWETAEALAEQARKQDTDNLGGRLYTGRIELLRGDFAKAATTFSEVTERESTLSEGWRNLGVAYERLGNSPQAVRAFGRAYANDPRHRATIDAYVRNLLAAGDPLRGLEIARSAASLYPNDPAIRSMRLRLEETAGDRKFALDERRELYKRNPDDRTNAIELAQLLGRLDPGREFVLDNAGKERYSHVRWEQMSTRERRDILNGVRREWQREADAIVARLASTDFPRRELMRLHAFLLQERDQIADGEQLLREYLAGIPEGERELADYLLLATYLTRTNQVQPALDVLNEARPLQTDQLEVTASLADLYFLTGQYQRALRELMELDKTRDERAVDERIIETMLRLRRPEDAERRLKQLTQEQGMNFSSWMLSAAIDRTFAEKLIAEGKQPEAQFQLAQSEEGLKQAEKADPTSLAPHLQRSQNLLQEFQRTKDTEVYNRAMLALERAEQVRANAPETAMRRADLMVARENLSGAVGEMRRLLRNHPSHEQARRRLVLLQVQRQNMAAAVEEVNRAIEIDPSNPSWHELLGDLRAQQRDLQGAIQAYRVAADLQPRPLILLKAADLLVSGDAPDYAAAVALLEPYGEVRANIPALEVTYAAALAGAGRDTEARDALARSLDDLAPALRQNRLSNELLSGWFRAATRVFGSDIAALEQFVSERAGTSPTVRSNVARAWAMSGAEGMSRAIELQQQAISEVTDEDPQLVASMYGALASYQLALDQDEAAVATLERLVSLTPDDGNALNNLAYVLADSMGRAKDALPHAQKAHRLLPDDPNVLDTLGWVQFKNGKLAEAEESLLRSVQASAGPSTLLHLATVQMERGKLDEAERTLDRALRLQPDEQTRSQINAMADDIRQRRG